MRFVAGLGTFLAKRRIQPAATPGGARRFQSHRMRDDHGRKRTRKSTSPRRPSEQYDAGAKFRFEAFWDAGFDVAPSADLNAPTEQYRTLRQAVATLIPSPTAPLKPTDPLSILQQLYESEFNFMLIAEPDGIEMRLGDAWNGFTWRGTFRTIGQAIEELAR